MTRYVDFPIRIPYDSPEGETRGLLYVVDLDNKNVGDGATLNGNNLLTMGKLWARAGMDTHRLVMLGKQAWRWNPAAIEWEIAPDSVRSEELESPDGPILNLNPNSLAE